MRRVRLFAPAVLVVGILVGANGPGDSGSGDDGPIDVERYRGGPAGVGAPPGGVGATIGGDGLHITTYGSSSCPNVPVSVTVSGPQTIAVVVEQDLGEGQQVDGQVAYVCTDDLGPTTSVVELPQQVDPDGPVSVVVSGEGRETRPVVAGGPG